MSDEEEEKKRRREEEKKRDLFVPRSLSLLLVLIASTCLTPVVRGQTTSGYLIVDEPLHIWVNPQNGSDANAAARNPHTLIATPDACTPAAKAANPMAVEPDPNFGVLMHAPYPFKTVTGAVAYLNSIFPAGLPVSNGIIGPPPWQYQVTVSHAIIHCLPGKYGRAVVQIGISTTQDPHNLLVPNGETFPISLPNRVSIQGTSALNTVFCLERDSELGTKDPALGPAFEFGKTAATAGFESTIDSISIYGAPVETIQGGSSPPPEGFSAIHLDKAHASSPTITNCFLFGNGMGVFVNAPNDVTTGFHTPSLVNNTIAGNSVGIWNGQAPPHATMGSQGVSRLLLINNILDGKFVYSNRLLWGENLPIQWKRMRNPILNTSAFEGVDKSDLRISGFGAPPGKPFQNNGDFNAYPANDSGATRNRFNTRGAFTGFGLPATFERGWTVAFDPVLNLLPIVGQANLTEDRGVLLVRDLFFNGLYFTAGTSNPYKGYNIGGTKVFDRSPMDFRLSPDTAPATARLVPGPGGKTPIAPGDTANGGARNFLVDRGYDGPFPMTMANGRSLTYRPGQNWPVNCSGPNCPTAHQWTFSSWDTDCEGFGNSRIFDHPTYSNTGNPSYDPVNGYGSIDIGADELGSNIIAGFRFGTTAFTHLEHRLWATGGLDIQNKFVWFLGPAGASGGNINGEYPRYCDGYPHHANGSVTLPHMAAWDPTATAPSAPVMVQTVPHLLPDIHPWWGYWTGVVPTLPVWHYHNACAAQTSIYNPSLFNFPTTGHINPPGSTDNTASPTNFYWLEEKDVLQVTLVSKPLTKFVQGPLGVSDNFLSSGTGGFVGGPGQILLGFGSWCQNKATTSAFTHHETWLPTFPYQTVTNPGNTSKPPYTTFRYSTEYIILGPLPAPRRVPPFGTSPTASNLQSFMVLVEGPG